MLGAKDILALQYDVVVRRPFLRCIVTGQDNMSEEMALERSLRDTEMVRSHFVKMFKEKKQGASRMEMQSLKKKKGSLLESC